METLPAPVVKRLDKTKDWAEAVKSYKIESGEDVELATQVLKEIKALLGQLTEDRMTVVRPLREAIKNLDSLIKPSIDVLKDLQTHLKDNLRDYMAIEEARTQKQLEDIRENSETMQLGELQEALVEVSRPQATHQHLSTAANWRAEVVDLEAVVRAVAAGDLPADILKIDLPKAHKFARSVREAREIHGLRIKNNVSIRTK